MNKLLNVSSSPHVRCSVNTQNLMLDVVIAMLPAAAFGVYNFGFHALLVLLVTSAVCVASEYVYEKLMHKPITIADGSALVTGMILALNMPPQIPVWVPALGGIFAIIVVKQLYGGLGQNFMNPALAARCFLLISFAGMMNNFSAASLGFDSVSGATPLAAMRAGQSVDLASMFIGRIPGTIGEVSTIALLIGGIYLLVRKVISWRIPVIYIGTVAVFVFIFGGFDVNYVLCQVCGGGLIFGAFFMATDYVTSPITPMGQIVFGVVLGLLTGIFRLWGASPRCFLCDHFKQPVCTNDRACNPSKSIWKGGKEGMKGILKDAAILFVITLVAGLCLGAVHEVTLDPIAKAQEAAATKTYKEVFPEAAKFEQTDELTAAVAASADEILAQGFGNVSVDDAQVAEAEDGSVLGYLITASSTEGYNGLVQISVGITSEGNLTGLGFLSISETPGLGMKAKEPDFKDQFNGMKAQKLEVTKTDATADNQVQAISGATYTSKAVTGATNAAIYFVENCVGK